MLFLIPTYLGENSSKDVFPEEVIQTVKKLRFFIVENEKSARKFIKFIHPEVNQSDLVFRVIDKRFKPEELEYLTQDLADGNEVGLLSEAGVPCIADPGNVIVDWAHRHDVKVKPLVGPSSIYLALMASGMNGQNFQFHGYLPIDDQDKKKLLKQLESESRREQKSQIFMETPYRNNALIKTLLEILQPQTKLCIATNVTLPEEEIITLPISKWKSIKKDWNKQPSIFIIQSI